MNGSDARRLETLETENARLKKLLADSMLGNSLFLKDHLGKYLVMASLRGATGSMPIESVEAGGGADGVRDIRHLPAPARSAGHRRSENGEARSGAGQSGGPTACVRSPPHGRHWSAVGPSDNGDGSAIAGIGRCLFRRAYQNAGALTSCLMSSIRQWLPDAERDR